jgi:hypothetical protein
MKNPLSILVFEPIANLRTAQECKVQKVCVDKLHLDEIPGAMDAMGWTVAAKLMRYWFAGNPEWRMTPGQRTGVNYRNLPNGARIEDTIVTMAWARNFEPVKKRITEIYSGWKTTEALGLLKSRLKDQGWHPGATTRLGYGLTRAVDLDMVCQCRFVRVGSYRDNFDDFFGAMNYSTLKLALVGTAHYDKASGEDRFHIDVMGLYLRDTYDFNEEALKDNVVGLGVWSRKRALSKIEMAEYRANSLPLNYQRYRDFVPVLNRDFRRWQDKHHTGADFYVFSDVYWVKPNASYVVIP